MAVEKEDIREVFEDLEDEMESEATDDFGAENGFQQYDTYAVDKKTGEVRFNYEKIKKIETVEDIKPTVFKILKGEIKPVDGYGVFFGTILDLAKEKIYVQSKIFSFIAQHYDFKGEDYLKSTFSMSKIENRLMTDPAHEKDGENQFKKLKDRETEIIAMQNALNTALEFVKLAERSSWGRKFNRDS